VRATKCRGASRAARKGWGYATVRRILSPVTLSAAKGLANTKILRFAQNDKLEVASKGVEKEQAVDSLPVG